MICPTCKREVHVVKYKNRKDEYVKSDEGKFEVLRELRTGEWLAMQHRIKDPPKGRSFKRHECGKR